VPKVEKHGRSNIKSLVKRNGSKNKNNSPKELDVIVEKEREEKETGQSIAAFAVAYMCSFDTYKNTCENSTLQRIAKNCEEQQSLTTVPQTAWHFR
jgi:hypothetical protein